MLSIKEFIIIVPRAISSFSWVNETIKHYKVEKKRNQNRALESVSVHTKPAHPFL